MTEDDPINEPMTDAEFRALVLRVREVLAEARIPFTAIEFLGELEGEERGYRRIEIETLRHRRYDAKKALAREFGPRVFVNYDIEHRHPRQTTVVIFDATHTPLNGGPRGVGFLTERLQSAAVLPSASVSSLSSADVRRCIDAIPKKETAAQRRKRRLPRFRHALASISRAFPYPDVATLVAAEVPEDDLLQCTFLHPPTTELRVRVQEALGDEFDCVGCVPGGTVPDWLQSLTRDLQCSVCTTVTITFRGNAEAVKARHAAALLQLTASDREARAWASELTPEQIRLALTKLRDQKKKAAASGARYRERRKNATPGRTTHHNDR